MEFRLNKIDTNLRQKINDETKEGKVHTKKGILIQDNKYEERKEQKNKKQPQEKFNISKYEADGKKIRIDAIKIENVEVKAEKEENMGAQSDYRGVFIDIRR